MCARGVPVFIRGSSFQALILGTGVPIFMGSLTTVAMLSNLTPGSFDGGSSDTTTTGFFPLKLSYANNVEAIWSR